MYFLFVGRLKTVACVHMEYVLLGCQLEQLQSRLLGRFPAQCAIKDRQRGFIHLVPTNLIGRAE